MSEATATVAFKRWLIEQDWTVLPTGPREVDVRARRGAERLVAEVKGHTGSVGTDVDTLYGQILRSIDLTDHATRYAIVVPESILGSVQRVDAAVRRRLGIDVYAVDDFERVRLVVNDGSGGTL